MTSAWQAAEDRRDLAFKEGRHDEAYGRPAHTAEEITANYEATFKLSHEWAIGDTICIADERRSMGVITDFRIEDVRVLLKNGTNYYHRVSPGMSVRRVT